MLHQRGGRGVFGNVCAAFHGEADVGGGKCGRVVDAVADHCHGFAGGFEFLHFGGFVARTHVAEGVDVIYLEGQNEKGKEDPHAWLNLENGMIFAKNIAKQLSAKDPSNKEFYEKNLKEYTDKLDKLDKEAKAKFDNIPAEKKLIVTSEGCFKYFSKAYGVPSAYIWEINTEEEGTPDQIKTLVEKLRQTKTPSLFVESSVDDRPMKTVSQDTNIPIYAQIFTDSIAEQGKEGDSYYNMMKYNLDKIAEGLAK